MCCIQPPLDIDYGKRKLCFGSRISRSKLRPEGPKPPEYPGPFEYNDHKGLLKKSLHKPGCTNFAKHTNRDTSLNKVQCFAPPIGTYDIEPRKPPKQCARPFGIGAKAWITTTTLVTPAPGTYSFFKRKVRVCTSFGHDRITVPLVKISCAPYNMAYCWKCEQTPIGDYWHKDSTNQDMCRPCMEQELADIKKCATKVLVRHRRKCELQMYRLMRSCEFFHAHNCTRAAVQIMPTRDLLFKLQKENYLASYGF